METSAIEMFKSTVQYQNELIWVKPVCDFFNLHDKNQYQKIKKDPILGKLWTDSSTELSENGNQYRLLSTDLGAVDTNGRILLSRKGFIRWVQIMNAKSVDENLRDRFVSYQELVFDYLYGSLQEEQETALHYQRLRKLERLYGKIGAEIKREKQVLAGYLDNRYQMKLNFNGQQALS
jgi:hypothetical protein